MTEGILLLISNNIENITEKGILTKTYKQKSNLNCSLQLEMSVWLGKQTNSFTKTLAKLVKISNVSNIPHF